MPDLYDHDDDDEDDRARALALFVLYGLACVLGGMALGALLDWINREATVTDIQGWITAISVAVIAGIQTVQFLLARR